MSRKLIFLLLSGLIVSPLPAAAQGTPAAPAVKKTVSEPTRPEEILPRTVFGVLLGELALQRGKFDIALGAYVDLARRTSDPRVLERAVELAIHSQQHELTLELSRKWLLVEPESAKAQQGLLSALIQLNRTDELGEQLARVLERDKSRLPDSLMTLNRILARQTDRQASARLVEKLAAPYAHLPEAQYAIGLAALSSGDQAKARMASAKALELRPDWERGALLRAQVLLKESNADARLFLEEFIAANPLADDARLSLARVYLSEKKEKEARAEFERVLERYPTSPEALYPAAMLALKENDLAAGRRYLERLLAGQYQDRSTLHYFLGQIEEEDKRTEAALMHYRQVTAGDQYLAARLRAAQLLVNNGENDAGIQILRDSQVFTPEEKAQLAMAESILLRDAKRYQEAYDRLARELQLQPENTKLLYDTAMAAERLGKLDVMERHLKKLIALDPKHAHALNALGYTLADHNKRLDEAYQLIRRALELAPNDPFIMDSLGWVQYRQGKLREALTTLEAAYKLRADPEIAAHLGEVLWRLDRRDEARKLWQDAAARHPDNEALTAVLKKHTP